LSDSCILLVEWLFLDTQKTLEPCTRSSFTWFGARSTGVQFWFKAVEKRLRELLAEKAEELQATIVALEVMPDHVHMFIETDPRWSISQLTRQFKGFTSHVLRNEFPSLRSRLPTLWSRSYFAGSCGAVTQATLRRYIQEQKRS
jgi:putative transposase